MAERVEAITDRKPSGGQIGDEQQSRADVEVVILAHNEELNLPHALESVVGWARAVHIVDSGSTDQTREIAERMGACVADRPWLGYARQKNWALENLPLQAGWVFILDADESLTAELKREIEVIVSRNAGEVKESGFYVNRLTYFMNKPIRHCGYYPSYNLRLFKRGTARYEDRLVHEHMIVDGPTARLKHIMLHNDRRGLEHFIAKHNRYSTLEAMELAKGRRTEQAEKFERGIAFRRWLKYNVLPRLPFGGLWRFGYMYFLRLGVLDGINGFRFCVFLASYDFFISLKLIDQRALLRENVERQGVQSAEESTT